MAKNPANQARLEILKTYKVFIGGKFPRSESGRFYTPEVNEKSLANICLCSRKDLRDAVVAARQAQSGWWGLTPYLRSQILYRIAEMLEGRQQQFCSELKLQGRSEGEAKREVQQAIDRWVYYAGWCDKYQQVFSSVNPVASPHFNCSVLEPLGVVFLIAPETDPLLGLVSLLAPIIAGGNAAVVLASESRPLSAITLAEVLATSDVPAGVVNILTGNKSELVPPAASHLDLNGVADNSHNPAIAAELQRQAAGNLKRIKIFRQDWQQADQQNPYLIQDFCEVKTTWHPIERITSSGSGY
jgi:acyl-CoA reductase-like NAD-dependent aldehyde dehydrogenase